MMRDYRRGVDVMESFVEELRLWDIMPVTGSVCSDHRLSVSAGLGCCGTEYNKKADKDKKKRRKAQRIARRKNR